MDAAIVENHCEAMVAKAGEAQGCQREHENHVVGPTFGPEIHVRRARQQVHGEEAIEFFAVPFIAGNGRGAVLRRPGVMGVRDGLEGELVQAHQRRIRRQLGRFF